MLCFCSVTNRSWAQARSPKRAESKHISHPLRKHSRSEQHRHVRGKGRHPANSFSLSLPAQASAPGHGFLTGPRPQQTNKQKKPTNPPRGERRAHGPRLTLVWTSRYRQARPPPPSTVSPTVVMPDTRPTCRDTGDMTPHRHPPPPPAHSRGRPQPSAPHSPAPTRPTPPAIPRDG